MTAPDSLERRDPRSWVSLFLACGGWWAGAILLVAIAAGVFGMRKLDLADRMASEGIVTVARVVARDGHALGEGGAAGAREQAAARRLTFRYRTPDGTVHNVPKQVSRRYARLAAMWSDWPIRYLPGAPETIEVQPGGTWVTGLVTVALAAALGLAGLTAGGLAWAFASAGLGLRDRGERRDARVVGRARPVRNLVPGLERLLWEEADGRTGRSMLHRRGTLAGYGPGAAITVYRLDDRAWWAAELGPARGRTRVSADRRADLRAGEGPRAGDRV